jgi:D-aminopeptidase
MTHPPFRARAAGLIHPGLPTGPYNAITDLAGVSVGQVTLVDDAHEPPIHTGVTVLIPHPGDLFNQKLVAAVHTINGYGKATGFEQVRELGTLETPIGLTNTLCVGRAWDGLVTWMLDHHPEIGTTGPSVNPLVAECNDSRRSDLRGRHVTAQHVIQALELAQGGPLDEGGAGAGAGMTCYGYQGGIGTSSRRVREFTLGVLLLANFGRREQLTVRGVPVGRLLQAENRPPTPGSVVILLGVDAPLTDRQLGRVARRAALGLARTGSTVGGGSGDFVIAFSTAQKIPQQQAGPLQFTCLPESSLDWFFDAAVEATEEAVLNALCAPAVAGGGGRAVPPLPLEQVIQLVRKEEDR